MDCSATFCGWCWLKYTGSFIVLTTLAWLYLSSERRIHLPSHESIIGSHNNHFMICGQMNEWSLEFFETCRVRSNDQYHDRTSTIPPCKGYNLNPSHGRPWWLTQNERYGPIILLLVKSIVQYSGVRLHLNQNKYRWDLHQKEAHCLSNWSPLKALVHCCPKKALIRFFWILAYFSFHFILWCLMDNSSHHWLPRLSGANPIAWWRKEQFTVTRL